MRAELSRGQRARQYFHDRFTRIRSLFYGLCSRLIMSAALFLPFLVCRRALAGYPAGAHLSLDVTSRTGKEFVVIWSRRRSSSARQKGGCLRNVILQPSVWVVSIAPPLELLGEGTRDNRCATGAAPGIAR